MKIEKDKNIKSTNIRKIVKANRQKVKKKKVEFHQFVRHSAASPPPHPPNPDTRGHIGNVAPVIKCNGQKIRRDPMTHVTKFLICSSSKQSFSLGAGFVKTHPPVCS